jgi:multimeric flavodoxin WrbA
MKVLAFNTSPDKENGTTDQILTPFIEGMKEKGAEVELIYTADLDINPCRACTEMDLFEYDGVCRCEDHMNSLYPKFREADLWVFASPVYANRTNKDLQNLLDRLEPLFQPTFPNGSPAESKSQGKIAFVGSSSMWSLHSFDPILEHIKSLSMMFERDFAGALVRPHAWTLSSLGETSLPIDDIFESAKIAGSEIINGSISEKTEKEFSKALVEEDTLADQIKIQK